MNAPTVTTQGEGVALAIPDEGRWTFELTAQAATADAALSEVSGRAVQLVALLDDLGVEPPMRSTSSVTVAEEFDYVEGRQVHRGFRASTSTAVRLAGASVAAQLVERAVTQVRAAVQGPVWLVAADNPARREACARAVQEAASKALAYATALGLGLGDVLEVREPAVNGAGPGPLRALAMDTSLPVEAGELEVRAAVTVTYALGAA